MLDRNRLIEAWAGFYSRRYPSPVSALPEMEERAHDLEEGMRSLARLPQSVYHGYTKKELEIARGMALGIHRQLIAQVKRLMGRLTFPASGEENPGRRGGSVHYS